MPAAVGIITAAAAGDIATNSGGWIISINSTKTITAKQVRCCFFFVQEADRISEVGLVFGKQGIITGSFREGEVVCDD